MNPGMIILLYMLYSSTKKKKKTSTAFKKPVFLSGEILNFKLSQYKDIIPMSKHNAFNLF